MCVRVCTTLTHVALQRNLETETRHKRSRIHSPRRPSCVARGAPTYHMPGTLSEDHILHNQKGLTLESVRTGLELVATGYI